MRTDAHAPGHRLASAAARAALTIGVWGGLLLGGAERAEAQASLFFVNSATRVESVSFRFVDGPTPDPDRLNDLLHYPTTARFQGLRRTFSFLPFVSDPSAPSFIPVELQRDIARLRRFYQELGFPNADLRYDVVFDRARNVVDITFVIEEGEPLRRGALTISRPDGSPVESALPSEFATAWSTFATSIRPAAGERVGSIERLALRDAVATWLRNRGWAAPSVESTFVVDSARSVVDVDLAVEPGARMRVDSIVVEGNDRIRADFIRRTVPLRPGDWYSASRLVRGQELLNGLDLVRFARTEVVDASPADSSVVVRARIEEGLPRLITAEGGYTTESGITVSASWAHRNFLGSARTFTVAATGQTGVSGIGASTVTRYGGSVSLKQPSLFGATSTGIVRPYVSYRDDLLDRSLEVGSELTVILQPRRSTALSFGYRLSRRHVLDYRGSGDSTDFLTRLAILDSIGTRVTTSALSASWLQDRLDDTRDPSSGRLTRLDFAITAPSAFSSVEFARIQTSVVGLVALSDGASLLARLGYGRLFPFGKSDPVADESALQALLPLRDALFTAGGSYDVRGWGEQMLGPKGPDVRGDLNAPETLTANRYVPFGGLARMQATLEARLPLPVVGQPRGLVVFLDTGRVWYPDRRFVVGWSDDERIFASTGGGLRFRTAVGTLGLVVGYKLNPSTLDLRDPNEVTRALVEGRSVLDLPTKGIRRFHLHITLGRDF